MNEQLKCPQCGTPRASGALGGLCPACLLKQGAAAESGTQPEQAPFEPPPVSEVTRLFPQLEVVELIGKGGMGAIYKARQPNLGRFVALKLLPPQRSGGPDFAERFNREARTLARLSHPNIVAVHEFGQVNGLHYFLMEYVDGVNLRQLQKTARLSPRQGLEIVPQICDALQYAHDEGVVHRDIKPENILVDRRGRVKIADFGLAKILGNEPENLRLTREGHVMGTPHYMAPEQVEHPLEVDHRADIYALGVVFYEMLTGELPLGKFSPPSRKVQVDVRLDEIVLRTLEKEPERRYQQASQVKTAVEHVAHAPSTTAEPVDPWRAGPRSLEPGRGRRAGLAASAGITVFFAVMMPVAALTFAWPRTYVSVARIQVERAAPQTGAMAAFDPYFIQTEFEKLRSRDMARRVVERLNLTEYWSWREAGEKLSSEQAAEVLLRSLQLRQTRNTALIEIRYYAADRPEAEEIANTYAEIYREISPNQVSIVARAQPSRKPARPNVPLNLGLGAIAGALLGLIAAAIVLLASFWSKTASQAGAAADQADGRRGRRWARGGVGLLIAGGLVWLVFTLLTGGLSRQVTVTGIVTDAQTGQPIAGARVALNQYDTHSTRATRETWTDTEGRFLLLTTYEGHHLVAFAPGYKTAVTMAVGRERSMSMDFQLVPAIVFGPVKDVLLNEFDSRMGDEALDLESGVLFSIPEEGIRNLPKQRQAWFADNGIDLVWGAGDAGVGVTGPNLKLTLLPNSHWDQVLAAELADLVRTNPPNTQMVSEDDLHISVLSEDLTQLPFTFGFQTALGNVGLFQVQQFRTEPASGLIRYKLAMPLKSAANPVTNQRRAGSAVPPPTAQQ